MKRVRHKGFHHATDLARDAIKRLGSTKTLFKLAAIAKFGDAVDLKKLRRAIDRWKKKQWLASWVRQFLYKGTYRRASA